MRNYSHPALDPKNEWEDRDKAVELLVPADDPFRYPGREIDDALAALLDPKLNDGTTNYILRTACRALGQRGRVEYFDKIVESLSQEGLAKPLGEDLLTWAMT